MERDLAPFLTMGVEFDPIVKHMWLPAIIILIALTGVMWFRKCSLSYVLCFFVFGAYLLYAIDKVFFPIPVTGTYADVMKQQPWTTYVNFIPFYFGPFTTLRDNIPTLFMNIVLTVPFGFGINFLVRTKPKKILWIALAVGFGTEITQFIIGLMIGYFYRIVDVNDVMMNTLGVLVGYVIFRIFAWLYLWATQRFGIELEGLAEYVHNIASQATSQQIHKPTS